jgi:hypothetical protein
MKEIIIKQRIYLKNNLRLNEGYLFIISKKIKIKNKLKVKKNKIRKKKKIKRKLKFMVCNK